jgi:uncharacterized protein YecT (DUF1311 family)
MHRPHLSLLVLAVALSACAPAALATPAQDADQEQLEREALKDCDANQMTLNLCSYHRYKALDAELNRLYQAQRARLKGTRLEQRFVESQRAWLRYRDADCLYQVGPREESGSIWPLEFNDCQSAHSRERIKLLKSFVDCRRDGCLGN